METKKLLLIYGGWVTGKGLLEWAYLCDFKKGSLKKIEKMIKKKDFSFIGEKVLEPTGKIGINGKDPIFACRAWVIKNPNFEIVKEIKIGKNNDK